MTEKNWVRFFSHQFIVLQKNHVGLIDPFQASVAFHIETSHLICDANQITGFYMKCNTFFKDIPKWCEKVNSPFSA